MKNQLTWLGILLVSIFCVNAFAAEGGTSVLSATRLNNSTKTGQLGLGGQVGSFSGVSGEYWATNDRAVEAAIAFRGPNTAFIASHNWFARDTFSGGAEALVPFIGIGGLVVLGNHDDALERHDEDFAFGVQIPLGVEFLPYSQRFSIFGKLAPSLEVTPIGVGFFTGDLGARFYF
jgi:hypothetical protein